MHELYGEFCVGRWSPRAESSEPVVGNSVPWGLSNPSIRSLARVDSVHCDVIVCEEVGGFGHRFWENTNEGFPASISVAADEVTLHALERVVQLFCVEVRR